MSRLLPILAVQSDPVAWDVDATSGKYERDVVQLLTQFPRTRLVVHPELFLSAVGPTTSVAWPGYSKEAVAEPVPGPLTERLGLLARTLGVWLVPGSFYERGDEGKIYNTAVAISPSGAIAATYRKIFPWRPWETNAAGSSFEVFEIEGVGMVGLMICYDGWFPEVPRMLAWLGAEAIVQVSATRTSDREQEIVLARANAIVNQVYVVNVNIGGHGPGRSVIVDPEGHVLQEAGPGEAFQTEILDLETVARVREHGSVGLNRMWDQLEREGGSVRLPMYDGAFVPRREARELTGRAGAP